MRLGPALLHSSILCHRRVPVFTRSAIVADGVRIDPSTEVGPLCVIEPEQR